MKVIELPNKKLRQQSKNVDLPLSQQDQKIAEMMIDYIDKSQEKNSNVRTGIGIAAVQLGFLKRMFYVNIPASDLNPHFRDFIINPEVLFESMTDASLSGGEGCLSVGPKDDKNGYVHRKFKIVITGYSYFKKEVVEYSKSGLLAIVFQHEIDHLNGKLYIDRIDDKKPWIARTGEEII